MNKTCEERDVPAFSIDSIIIIILVYLISVSFLLHISCCLSPCSALSSSYCYLKIIRAVFSFHNTANNLVISRVMCSLVEQGVQQQVCGDPASSFIKLSAWCYFSDCLRSVARRLLSVSLSLLKTTGHTPPRRIYTLHSVCRWLHRVERTQKQKDRKQM